MSGKSSNTTVLLLTAVIIVISVGGFGLWAGISLIKVHTKLDKLSAASSSGTAIGDIINVNNGGHGTASDGDDDDEDSVSDDAGLLTLSSTCNDLNSCTGDYLDAYGTCVSRNKPNDVDCASTCLAGNTGTCSQGVCSGSCKGDCAVENEGSECPEIFFKDSVQLEIDDNFEYDIGNTLFTFFRMHLTWI